jgi:ubiquinol-cytochrome c reductase cytochrome b subunit
VACLAVLAAVLCLIIFPRLMNPQAPLGAELGAPADPSESFPARPEWYFLFLFQFLKFFPGQWEIVGAIIIPSLGMLIMALMPIFGKWRLGHTFNLWFLGMLLAGAGFLTWYAKHQDGNDPVYQLAVATAERNAERVRHLAMDGIPPEGALALLRNDPLTQGPRIFAQNCASCHRYDGHDGTGHPVSDPQTAADLKGFASREWLAGLLDPARVASTQYFGGTKFSGGKMAGFVKKSVAAFSAEEKKQLEDALAALSAEAGLPAQAALEKSEANRLEQGRALVRSEAMRCTECHAFRKPDEDATAPDLTSYGSRAWTVEFIKNPAHEKFYGKRNDRMPAFGPDKLDERSLGLVVDWLRGDWPGHAK